ncbi:MAG: DNA-binding protein WhiA [Clostridiales bacterium]|nr:DNA-binding protein WhiA [Clostridiales bacterium]MDU2293649.1 DNA-binding protein WhiA [Peptococcus niger]MDU7245244.1 DNA-binding protein WhiA [Clostridiales bacterium]
MSYSAKVKNELVRLPAQDDGEQVAQLAGIARMDGSILIGSGKRIALVLVSENAAVARQAYSWLRNLFHLQARIEIQRNTKLKKNIRYVVRVPGQPRLKTALTTLGMMNDEGLLFRSDIAPEFTDRDHVRRAYLRGIFLGSGSLTDPQRSYHLELVTQSEEFAEQISALIIGYGIEFRMSYRKENCVLYLKESEQISDFLALVGAHEAVMDLENVRVAKGVRNKVNRLVNCETANMNKAIDAALRQVEMIEAIKAHGDFDKLPRALQQVANLRLQAPEASLKELGELCDPPIGKSGINHRMRRLTEFAKKMGLDGLD